MENRSFRKSLAVGIIVLFLGVSVIPSVVGDNPSFVNTIYVDDDNIEGPWDGTQEHPYQYIQDGVDASGNGDTVFVYNGTYYEKIHINKSIILLGQDKYSTIIDGMGTSSSIISIRKDETNISGFTVRNTIYYNINNEDVGIYIESSNILISDNVISNISIGIDLWYANNCIISGNKIKNTQTGIRFSGSDKNTIKGNEISENDNGIFFLESSYNIITNNTFKKNNYGQLFFSWWYTGINTNIEITYNSYIENNNGIDIGSSWPAIICYNNFIKNKKNVEYWVRLAGLRININYNYWDRARFLPKVIFGIVGLYLPFIPRPGIIIDWHPAKEPYDIPEVE